jgi:hypothetical protein
LLLALYSAVVLMLSRYHPFPILISLISILMLSTHLLLHLSSGCFPRNFFARNVTNSWLDSLSQCIRLLLFVAGVPTYCGDVIPQVDILTRLWAARLRNVVRFPARTREFSLLQSVHTVSGAHPASCRNGTGDFSSGIKLLGREAAHDHLVFWWRHFHLSIPLHGIVFN